MSDVAKQQKQLVIDEIKAKLDGAQSAILVDYMGITVEQADKMRRALREADVDYTVYKNTLVKRAIEGTDFESLKDHLAGPSAIAISKTDATAPARTLNGLIKEIPVVEFKALKLSLTFLQEMSLLLSSWEAFSHQFQHLLEHFRLLLMQKQNSIQSKINIIK